MLDWNDLRYFLAVAAHGSTIAAAKALGVNQSTVQRRIGELDVHFGRALMIRQAQGYRPTEFGEFLRFETLTLCPIDTRCLDLTLLRADERAWINDYHAVVRARLAPHVSGAAAAWLHTRTEAI